MIVVEMFGNGVMTKASYNSAYYLRKGEKESLIKPNEFYKYDIKESGIRGEAWTTNKAYFSDYSGSMEIDSHGDANRGKKKEDIIQKHVLIIVLVSV